LAAVGHEDSTLLLLLGDAAVASLPLLSLGEVGDLASAFAALGVLHPLLLPALLRQLPETAKRCRAAAAAAVVISG
jgi:hypothetical protein